MCGIVSTPSAPASPSGWWQPNWPWAVGNGHACIACGQWVLSGSYHYCPGALGVVTTSWVWCTKHRLSYDAGLGCCLCALDATASGPGWKLCPECRVPLIQAELPRCVTCDHRKREREAADATGPHFRC